MRCATCGGRLRRKWRTQSCWSLTRIGRAGGFSARCFGTTLLLAHNDRHKSKQTESKFLLNKVVSGSLRGSFFIGIPIRTSTYARRSFAKSCGAAEDEGGGLLPAITLTAQAAEMDSWNSRVRRVEGQQREEEEEADDSGGGGREGRGASEGHRRCFFQFLH